MTKPKKLMDSYGGPGGEHPTHTPEKWAAAAAGGLTRDGYWEWVSAQVRDENEPITPRRAELRLLAEVRDMDQFSVHDGARALDLCISGVYKLIRGLLRRGLIEIIDEIPNAAGPGKLRIYKATAHGMTYDTNETPQPRARAYKGVCAHNPFGIAAGSATHA